MNKRKIQYTILACVLISGIVFSAVNYSEPLRIMLGYNNGFEKSNITQSKSEAVNDDRVLAGSDRFNTESSASDSEEWQIGLQDDYKNEEQNELQNEQQDELKDEQPTERQAERQNTYKQKNRIFIAEQTNEDQYATSRGEASRFPNEKPKTVAEQPKAAAVLKDEPDNSESMNINPETTQEASLDDGNRSAVPSEEAQETTDAASELDLLARLITAEAQGEPYEAQVAVGAVVMNRVESSSWPESIEGVIYQVIDGYYQFTPVVNGWIDKPAQEQSIRAAKEVLAGADPTNGAQFYYDDTTTNPWILAKTVSVQIGHMIFAF